MTLTDLNILIHLHIFLVLNPLKRSYKVYISFVLKSIFSEAIVAKVSVVLFEMRPVMPVKRLIIGRYLYYVSV